MSVIFSHAQWRLNPSSSFLITSLRISKLDKLGFKMASLRMKTSKSFNAKSDKAFSSVILETANFLISTSCPDSAMAIMTSGLLKLVFSTASLTMNSFGSFKATSFKRLVKSDGKSRDSSIILFRVARRICEKGLFKQTSIKKSMSLICSIALMDTELMESLIKISFNASSSSI